MIKIHFKFSLLIQKFDLWPQWLQISIKSIGTTIPIYLTALLSAYVKKMFDTSDFKFHSIVIIILIAILVFIKNYFGSIREQLANEQRIKKRIILQAYSYCNRFVMENMETFHKHIKRYISNPNDSNFNNAIIRSMENIKSLIDKLYLSLESHFGNEENLQGRIEFEVTFMTRSYLDGEITIPASANKDKRAPRSMILRKDNPEIYRETVTAEVYAEERPQPHIIESTVTDVEYKELYNSQKQRIKSSIVYPILSDENQLLGTLVIHCNKERFFVKEDLQFWIELLEISAKRIAFEKIQLDLMNEVQGKLIKVTLDTPF